MKKMLLILFAFVNVSLFAQTSIQTQLVVIQNDGTNGGSFKVAIQAKGTNLTANSTIGSVTIDVDFNAANIAPVIVGGTIVSGTYNATIGSNYTRSLSFVAGGPYVRLSVSGGNINGNGDGTPSGLDLTSSYQTIATINFTISDNTVTTNLTIATGSLTIGLFDSPNNSNLSGNIVSQTMSAPVNITNAPLPVELTSFNANTISNKIELDWKTSTEVNNYGFEVERSLVNSHSSSVNGQWKKIGFIKGNGNSNSTKQYSFVDNDPSGGSSFQYRLKQIDNSGKFKYSDVVDVNVLPNNFNLFQNFPNPFNPTTVIKYQLRKTTNVKLFVYNITGQKVTTLVDRVQDAGFYEVNFNAANFASGIYFYSIQADNFVQIKKMILLK